MRLAALALLAAAAVLPAAAAPVATAEEGTVRITLTDEPCALACVAGLTHRAVWVDGARTWEACWGQHPMGVIVLYFDDRSLGLVPARAFRRARGL